jgi:eukaryotic-like serine/threonine-protein kinase
MSMHQISGFEIVEKLGEGGMASVWKARQISLDRTVAIKILSDRFAGDPDDIRRFQEEAQAAAKLKHPGIVQVHDANAENGIYYFIMEFVAGYTVGDWVRRKGVLSEQDALSVAECVADALGYAWNRAGIIHCDIKPDNIIIDADGTVKVADLGLARTIGAMESVTEVPTEVMGTPAYMSPEQAEGDPNLDFRADIYALGAMLYHLVTGKMMFQGEDENTILEKQICDRVEDPIDLKPTLSKGICWLIERMTAKDPDLREDSWSAVAEDILRVRRGLLPLGKVLPKDASTVCRSSRRTLADYQRVVRLQKVAKAASAPTIRTAFTTACVAVAIAVGIRLYMFQSADPVARIPSPQPTPAPAPIPQVVTNTLDIATPDAGHVPLASSDIGAEDDDRGRDMYDFAQAWYADNPDDLAGAIAQFETVARETRGTKYSLMARSEIRALATLRTDAIRRAGDLLLQQVKALTKEGNFDEAIRIVNGYRGRYAGELEGFRRELRGRLLKEQVQWRAQQQRTADALHEHRQKSEDALTMAILSDDLPLAMQMVTDMTTDPAFGSSVAALEEARGVLAEASEIDRRIMNSFAAQRGETIDVQLTTGAKQLTIGAMRGESVECRQMLSVGRGAMSTILITISDLSTREQLSRMGADELHEVALAKGIMAFQSRAYSHAEKYFAMTHPLLSEQLLRRLQGDTGDSAPAVSDVEE